MNVSLNIYCGWYPSGLAWTRLYHEYDYNLIWNSPVLLCSFNEFIITFCNSLVSGLHPGTFAQPPGEQASGSLLAFAVAVTASVNIFYMSWWSSVSLCMKLLSHFVTGTHFKSMFSLWLCTCVLFFCFLVISSLAWLVCVSVPFWNIFFRPNSKTRVHVQLSQMEKTVYVLWVGGYIILFIPLLGLPWWLR